MAWRTANGMLVGPGMKRPWNPDISLAPLRCRSVFAGVGRRASGVASRDSRYPTPDTRRPLPVDRKPRAELRRRLLHSCLDSRVARLAVGRQSVEHLDDHVADLPE